MTERLTHEALLRELRSSHAALAARIAPLTEAYMTTPGVNGAWAMRDMIAHLTAWQRRALALLEAARDGTTPDTFYTDPTDEQELDRRNAMFFAESRTRPLAPILTEWHATEQAIEAAVSAVSEDDLNAVGRFLWLHGRTLARNVVGETYEHTGDHLPDIDAFLASHTPATTQEAS